MKKFLTIVSCLLLLSLEGAAQKSVSALPPAHASAVQQFLSAHPDLDFLSEERFDRDTLKWMRESHGPRFTPFYQRGDFNRDGVPDFAAIFVKNKPPKEDPDLAESHRYRYDVAVVIFNGTKEGGYKAVFIKTVSSPLVCFLSRDKRGRLAFGVAETDEGFMIRPSGRGYMAEN